MNLQDDTIQLLVDLVEKEQRRIYHDQHCKGDWGDAKCYDLVINSARLDIPGTVDILEQYIRSRAAQFDDRPAGE